MKKEVKNIFNQSYQQHQSDVDPASIWEAIEKKKQKKNRKGIIWWLFGSSLFVVALLVYQFLGTEVENTSVVSEVLEEKEHESTSLSVNKNTDSKTAKSNGNINIEENNQQETQQKTLYKQSKETKKSVVEKEIPTAPKPTKLIKKTKGPTQKTLIDGFVKSKPSSNNKIAGSNSKIDQSIESKQNDIAVKGNIDRESSLSNSIPVEPNSSLLSNMVIEGLEQLKVSLNNLNIPVEVVVCYLDLASIEESKDEEAPSEKDATKKASRLSLTVLGTAGLFNDKFSNGDSEYLALRSGTEKALESFGSELMLKYEWKNIGIESGVDYLRTNRIMEWSNKYFGDVNGRPLYPHDPNRINPALLVEGQDSIKIYLFESSLRKYNETHTVSIPLKLSYMHSIKSINIGVFGGTAFHIFQKNNVDVLAIDKTLLDQRLDSYEIKRRPDLLAGVFVDYRLQDLISLSARLGFRHRKTTEPTLIRQTGIYTFGLGVKYHL